MTSESQVASPQTCLHVGVVLVVIADVCKDEYGDTLMGRMLKHVSNSAETWSRFGDVLGDVPADVPRVMHTLPETSSSGRVE